MRSKMLLGLAATLAVLATAHGKLTEVRTRYSSELGSITLLGVCSADGNGGCWDAQGRPSKPLTLTFRKVYAREGLPIRFGRKTRVALFRFIDKAPTTTGSRLHRPIHQTPEPFPWPDPAVTAEMVFAPIEAKTGEVGFGATRLGPFSEQIPFKRDVVVQHGGVAWSFIGTFRGTEPRTFPAYNTLVISSNPPTHERQWRFLPVDGRGRPIFAITPEGYPLPGEPEPAVFWTRRSFPWLPAVDQATTFYTGPSTIAGGVHCLATMLRLEEISAIRVQRSESESIRFKDIPMEPKR